MIDFILYNDFFINFLIILLIFTLLLTSFTKKEKKKKKLNKRQKFEDNIIDFFITLILILLCLLIEKYKVIFSISLYIIIFLTFRNVFKNYAKNSLVFSYENKQQYSFAALFFTMFFSASASNIYIESFSSLNHTLKEIMLLFYLVLKIIFSVFFILINFSIILSNIQLIFGKKLTKLIKKISKIKISYVPKYYNFYFSSKKNSKLNINIDKLIYFITCPFCVIFNLAYTLVLFTINKFLSFIKKSYKSLLNYNNSDNRTYIIKTIMKIAFIISLVLVYICTIYDKKLFSLQIKEIYNLFATVLLIPIIYDSIKAKDNSNINN